MQARKKLLAIAADLAPLDLDSEHTRALLGEHGWIKPDGSAVYFLICRPVDWRAAQKFLAGLGVACFPHHHDPQSKAADFYPANPQKGLPPLSGLPAGIVESDGGWAVGTKLLNEYRWPPFDPLGD